MSVVFIVAAVYRLLLNLEEL